MSTTWALLLTVVLLGVNAFFVAAEFAVISARRSQIEGRAEDGSRAARITLGAMEDVSSMLAGAQLGITLCSLLLGALSEPALAHLIEVPASWLGVPEGWVHPIAFVLALSLVTVLHVVLGEMVPKNLALAMPDRLALLVVPPLVVVVAVLSPLIRVLNAVANAVLRLCGVEPRNEVSSAFTRDEVAELVTESRAGGMLDAREGELLIEALEFEGFEVESVMIELGRVTTLPVGVSTEQAEEVARAGFSRFPLEAPDGDLVGYVHVKDLFDVLDEERDQPVKVDAVRELVRIEVSTPLRAVLSIMRESGAHLAAVVRGGTVVGIVTLEDVLAELVGQIRHDAKGEGAR